ncbi:hypothetical protein JCM8202_002616 [Rhodotorula sphaerocarpa]
MAPKKRKVVDLSVASSDEDSSSSFEPPSGPKAGPSKSTTARVKKKKEASPERKHLQLAQANGKSDFLRPRSILFGGKGTGNEHAGLLHGPGHGDEDSTVTAPKRRRKSAEEDEAANALLRFEPDAEEAEDAADRLARLKFGRGSLFSDTDDDSKATLDTILGKDPDTEAQRALVVSSSVQLPWLRNRFASTRMSKPRPEKEHLSLSEDEGKDGSHKAIKEQEEGSAASPIFRQTREERFHLRIAIGSAEATPDSWSNVEQVLWVQDFPELRKPAASAEENPSHTAFSSALLNFLRSSFADVPRDKKTPQSKALRKVETCLARMNFSNSEDLRAVVSDASGEALDEAGGLTSLAQAMESLSPSADGAGIWRVEYATPRLGRLSRKFLERLHAAAQGIPPLEYVHQESERAKAAKSAYAEHHGMAKKEPVVVLFPTKGDVEGSAEKQAKYHVKWEGEPWEALKKGDLRGTVLRQLDLKSSRINGSTDSWGTYNYADPDNPTCTLHRTDLGVLYRCATAPICKDLLKDVSDLVPYVRYRGPEKFGGGEEPAVTAEPKPPRKKPGRKVVDEGKKE